MFPWMSFQNSSYWSMLLLLTILTVLTSGEGALSGKISEETCPCLPMGKCPRIYGQSAADIRELGFQEPCHQFGTVRCCGVTIRIEHEKDSERNWNSLIGSPPPPPMTKETRGPETNYSPPEGTDSDMPWTPNGTTTTLDTPPPNTSSSSGSSSSPLTKLRRRKPQGPTRGGPPESPAGPLKNSSPEISSPVLTPRPNILIRRFKDKAGTLSSPQQGSSSSPAVTSMTSGPKSPVFTRIRKQPLVHLGIKLDSNLPPTLSKASPVRLEEEREKNKEEQSFLSGSSNTSGDYLLPSNTLLDIGINVHGVDLSLTPSPPPPPAVGDKRKVSTFPKFGNVVTNRSRVMLGRRPGVGKPLTPEITLDTSSSSSSLANGDGGIGGSSQPPAAIKLRRPLRRRPVAPANPTPAEAQVSSTTTTTTIHSSSPPGSNSILQESLPKVAIKIEGTGAGNLTQKYKKRIRIHPITTTTTTTTTTTQAPPLPESTPANDEEEKQKEGISNYKYQESKPFQPFWNQDNREETKKEFSTNPGHHDGQWYGHVTLDHVKDHVKEEATEEGTGPSDYHHGPNPSAQPPMETVLSSTLPPLTPTTSEMTMTYPSWQTHSPSLSSPVKNHHDVITVTTDAPWPTTAAPAPWPMTDAPAPRWPMTDAPAPLDDYASHPRYPTRVYSIHSGSDAKVPDEPRVTPTLSPRRRSQGHKARGQSGARGPVISVEIEPELPTVPSTPTVPLQQLSSPSANVQNKRRFKIPANFLRPIDHPTTSTVRSFVAPGAHEEVAGNGESYDMILDKESRENLKHQQTDGKVSETTNYVYPEESGRGDSLAYPSHGESGQEETRVYPAFVEKTSTSVPPLSFEANHVKTGQGRTKYRRIPMRNRLDTPTITPSGPTVQSLSHSTPTLLHNPHVGASTIEITRAEESLPSSSSAPNSNSKRFKAQLSPLPSSPPRPPMDRANQDPTTKFNFPPFVSRDSYGPPPTTTTTPTPTPPPVSNWTGGQGLSWPEPSSTTPVYQEPTTATTPTPTTTAYISVQIIPTDIPTSVPTTTTPMSIVQQHTRPTWSTPTPPSQKLQKSRFTVPKTFDFGKSDNGGEIQNQGMRIEEGTKAAGTDSVAPIQNTYNPTSHSHIFLHQESTTPEANNQFQPDSNSTAATANNNDQGRNPSRTTSYLPIPAQGGTYIDINNSSQPIPTPDQMTSWRRPQNSLPPPPYRGDPLESARRVPNRGNYPPQPHFRTKLQSPPQVPQNSREPNYSPPPGGRFREKPQGQIPPPQSNGLRGQPGFVTQGGKIIPVRIHAEILTPPAQNLNSPQSRFPPGQTHRRPPPALDSVRYSSNQFNPYGSSGSPVQFPPNTPPHYVREYHQHHSITKEILNQLQNSIRTSRSANLTTEEVESLLEMSPADKDLDHKMELMSPLFRKLDLDEEDEKLSPAAAQTLENSLKDKDGDEEQRNVVLANEIQIQKNSTNEETSPLSGETRGEPITGPDDGLGGFRAPKTIQRGFFPILPYSDTDPGLTMVNVQSGRTSRALSPDKVLFSLTGPPPPPPARAV